MTDLTAPETIARVIRSLKENNAEFARKARAQRNAKIRIILFIIAVFAAGLITGILIR